jgi:hypothetical protein
MRHAASANGTITVRYHAIMADASHTVYCAALARPQAGRPASQMEKSLSELNSYKVMRPTEAE